MENSLAHRSMFSNIKNLESWVYNRKFWIPNSKRKFANAALFGCIFAPALLGNLLPTNTTNTSSCITICQILAKMHHHCKRAYIIQIHSDVLNFLLSVHQEGRQSIHISDRASNTHREHDQNKCKKRNFSKNNIVNIQNGIEFHFSS